MIKSYLYIAKLHKPEAERIYIYLSSRHKWAINMKSVLMSQFRELLVTRQISTPCPTWKAAHRLGANLTITRKSSRPILSTKNTRLWQTTNSRAATAACSPRKSAIHWRLHGPDNIRKLTTVKEQHYTGSVWQWLNGASHYGDIFGSQNVLKWLSPYKPTLKTSRYLVTLHS